MLNNRVLFVSPNARRQLLINSVTLYSYDAAVVMDDDNYATVLKTFVGILSLLIEKVNTEKVSGLHHLVLAKKWGISPKKALNMIHCTTQHGVCTVLHPSLLRQLRRNNC